jgi:hypothetical protein
MTGTDLCVNKPHLSQSYLNHLVFVTYECGCGLQGLTPGLTFKHSSNCMCQQQGVQKATQPW